MAALVLLAGCSPVNPAEDGVAMGGFLPGGAAVFPRISSYRDEAFANIVRQHTDFSCGAAALATILKYAYGMDITEPEMIRGLFRVSDPQTARQRGFSLLDMKSYLETIGMQGAGYQVSFAALLKVRVPVIVLLNMRGYEHFVVVRHATPDAVFVADPALGNRGMPSDLFQQDWQYGVIFAVIGKQYIPDNVLVSTEKPLNLDQQVRSLTPAFNPLGDWVLATTLPASSVGLLVQGATN